VLLLYHRILKIMGTYKSIPGFSPLSASLEEFDGRLYSVVMGSGGGVSCVQRINEAWDAAEVFSIPAPAGLSGNSKLITYNGNLYMISVGMMQGDSTAMWKLNALKNDWVFVVDPGYRLENILICNNNLYAFKSFQDGSSALVFNSFLSTWEVLNEDPITRIYRVVAYKNLVYATIIRSDNDISYTAKLSGNTWIYLFPSPWSYSLCAYNNRLYVLNDDTNLQRLNISEDGLELVITGQFNNLFVCKDRLFIEYDMLYKLNDTFDGVDQLLFGGEGFYGIGGTFVASNGGLYFFRRDDYGYSYLSLYNSLSIDISADTTVEVVPFDTTFTPIVYSDVSKGVVAYYPFNNNANDEYQGQFNCTVNGASLTTDRFGASNRAYNFNGISQSIAPSSGLYPTIDTIGQTFTYSLWVSPTTTRVSTAESLVGVSGNSGQRYALFPNMGVDNGDSFAGISVGTNGISVFEQADSYFPSLLVYDTALSGWTHIVVVYEKNRPRLYVNGVFIKYGLQSSRAVRPAVLFGGNAFGWYQGKIDEAVFFSRAITESEISEMYSTPYQTPAPRSYSWQFGDGGVSTLENPTHTYSVSKGYDITLESSNDYDSLIYIKEQFIFAIEPFRVKYDGNGSSGGTVPVDSGAYPGGTSTTVLPLGNLVRENYYFTQWNTQYLGYYDSYLPGDQLYLYQDVILYAIWSKNPKDYLGGLIGLE